MYSLGDVTMEVLISAERTQALRASYGFTKREAEVAQLLLARRSNLEIAEHFSISRHTARHHVQKVLWKLGVSSRVQARQLMAQNRHH